MVRDLAFGPYLRVKQRRKVNTKDRTMNTQSQFETPTRVEVQKIIQQAHRMRSEYLATSIKAGLSNCHARFSRKKSVGGATA